MTNPQSKADGPASPALSNQGTITILMATALALLATPLVAPAMKDIAVALADQVDQEPLARWILLLFDFLPGQGDVNFLVKFIMLSIPALFIVASAPLTGWFADNVGRKPLLIGSLLLFAFSGMSGFFASTFTGHFVGRALLGLSVAGIKTATVTMAGDFFKGEERARFLGLQGSAMKMGGIVFMLLGGYLASVNFSVPFLAYALALVAVPSAIWAIRESRQAGASQAVGDDAKTASIVDLAKPFVGAFVASVLFYISVVQMNFFLSDAFQLSNFYTGLTVAIGNTVSAAIAFKYGAFKTRFSYVSVFAMIFAAMSVGYLVIGYAPSYAVVVIGIMIAGLGFGLIVPNQSAWIISVVSPARRGFGVGLVTTAMFLGQFAGPIIIQPFVDPANPFQVFRIGSATLAVLAVVYAVAGKAFAQSAADSKPAVG
ncbi:MAG: MFS transporter [Pseudomonadota bacterium]